MTMLLVLGVIPLLSACSESQAEATKSETVKVVKVGPANEITLEPKAAERLGIKTVTVVAGPAGGGPAVPHSSLLYEPNGKAFVYISPKELVYTRSDVTVLRISNETVFLSTGPAVGTAVVTVGASELFGVDTGVGGSGH